MAAAPSAPISASNSTTVCCVTAASLAYWLHTGSVQILIGTASGLGRLDADGHLEWLLKGDVSRVAGGWAVLDDRGLVRIDHPATVVPLSLTPQCVAAVEAGVLVGTAEAHLHLIGRDRSAAIPVESFDAIPTRDQWYTPWGGPPDTRSITVTADGAALVNVHVGGVWRGTVASDEWDEVIPVDDDTHQILAAPDDPSLVAAAAAVGFGQSCDGGRTFAWTTEGLHASYCRAVALTEDNVLVTASTGPFTQHGAVYVRPIDSPGPFLRCDIGLPEWFAGNIDTFQMTAAGTDVVIGTETGDVYLSTDDGASWERVLDGLDPIRCVKFGK